MKTLYLLLIGVAAASAHVLHPSNDAAVTCVKHPGCPKRDPIDSTVHLPYEQDCHKFYKCLAGRGCLMSCPFDKEGEQLVFNPEEQVCDWPGNVPDGTCPDDDSSTPSTTASSSTASESTVSSTESTTESSSTASESTVSSTESTTESSSTASESTVSSTESTTESSSTASESTVSSTESTTESSSTASESTVSSTESTTESSSTASESTVSSTESTSTTPDVGPWIIPGKCPENGNALVIHECDCNAYYNCHDGKRTGPSRCQENHIFNPIISACDVVGSFDCGSVIHEPCTLP